MTYEELLRDALMVGTRVSPRGLPTYQSPPIQIELPMGTLINRRGFNIRLAAAEGLNLMRGYTDIELIRSVAPKVAANFYDTNDMSFYGERCNIRRILRLLRTDPMTRKATAVLATNEDADRSTRCIVFIQFQQLVPGRLDMHVHLRSWDLYLGLPMDVGMTQYLACYVARYLRLERGTCYYSASMPHLYESHVERAKHCNPGFLEIPDDLARPAPGAEPLLLSWGYCSQDLEARIRGRTGLCLS